MRQLFFNAFTLRAADGAFTPRCARRTVPSHLAARGGRCFRTTQHAAKQCPRFVLVADCRGRSLKKNRTSDKLELTLSDMSEVLLFFLFVSLPAVPAPAEDAPALFRRALTSVRMSSALFGRALTTVRMAPALSCRRFPALPNLNVREHPDYTAFLRRAKRLEVKRSAA